MPGVGKVEKGCLGCFNDAPKLVKGCPIHDKPKEEYVGPCGLNEALNAASPSATGIQVAVSSPDSVAIAMRDETGNVRIRYVNKISGHAGSIKGTGKWIHPSECPLNSWRPA